MSQPSSVCPRQPGGDCEDSGVPAAAGSVSSGARRRKGLMDIRVDEEVEIAVTLALERFRYGEEKEMEFPSSFTSTERAFVHRLCQSLGLISKSKG
uniref:R3H domain-containing protein n=1 Tax=Strix occidentalis caurina TaxID=311401 RepID=A0A8D0KZ96_STROC